MCAHKRNRPRWPQWSALEVRPCKHPHRFAEDSPSVLFLKSLLPSEPVIFITYSVLQSLWCHRRHIRSPFCFILWESVFCKFVIHLAFCHQLLARFTLCKVKLMIEILVAGGLERLTDHGCSEIGNRPFSWHSQSWFAFFFFLFPFPGLQVISHVHWEKLRKFSEAERKIQKHWSYYPKIASVEDSGFCTFSIFIHTWNFTLF